MADQTPASGHAAPQTYAVVHLVTGGEFAKPLVASQVFDQAQVQAICDGPNRPRAVEVWLIEPMRLLMQRRVWNIIGTLRRRCPDVRIRLYGGIGRLNSWPALSLCALVRRRRFGSMPIVYHCRGESAAAWGARLRTRFAGDAVVLDVRGSQPLEVLFSRGLLSPESAGERDRHDYNRHLDILREAVRGADAVTTVSRPLREWLKEHAGAPAGTIVIPCCVKAVTGEASRATSRARWGATEGDPVVLFLGKVNEHQHLSDLCLPFMRRALELHSTARAVLLTSDPVAMTELVRQAGLDPTRTIIESRLQAEVAEALTGGDIGLLLRAPTPVNQLSQPTKLAEYLAAGVPVVVEAGTGEVSTIIERAAAGVSVKTAHADSAQLTREVRRVLDWLAQHGAAARRASVRLAEESFTWSSATPFLRRLYVDALAKRPQRAVGAMQQSIANGKLRSISLDDRIL